MNHHIQDLHHTLLVTYVEEVTTAHVEALSTQVLEILKSKEFAVNIIMDVREGHSYSMLPAIKAGTILLKHLKKFNYCYIVGHNKDKYDKMMTFFKSVGAAKKRVHFFATIEEAKADIEIHWEHYNKKQG